MTREEREELRERSKRDDALSVGSEVRQLCDAADRLEAECTRRAGSEATLREDVKRLTTALTLAQANDERADLKLEVARLTAERDAIDECQVDGRPPCHGNGKTDVDWCRSCLLAEYRTATAERDAAQREAERLRHGAPVEGDFVCPNEVALHAGQRALAAEEARATQAERELSKAQLTATDRLLRAAAAEARERALRAALAPLRADIAVAAPIDTRWEALDDALAAPADDSALREFGVWVAEKVYRDGKVTRSVNLPSVIDAVLKGER